MPPLQENDFGRAYRQGWESVVEAAYRIVGDREVANEIAQEAYLRTWRERGRISDRFSAHGFARTVAIRLSRNARRDLARRKEKSFTLPGLETSSPGPAEDLEFVELLARIHRYLSPKDAVLFRLRFEEGQTTSEIAQSLGVSEKTVLNRIAQLRRRLEEILSLF